MYLRKVSAVIIAAAASAILLVVLLAACGGDSESDDGTVTGLLGEIDVSALTLHDPAGDLVTVAVRFDPVPRPDDELTMEVLNLETEEVVSTLTVDESVTSSACGDRSFPRTEGWVVFSTRGPDAGGLAARLLNAADQHELILTLRRDDDTEQSSLNIPFGASMRWDVAFSSPSTHAVQSSVSGGRCTECPPHSRGSSRYDRSRHTLRHCLLPTTP